MLAYASLGVVNTRSRLVIAALIILVPVVIYLRLPTNTDAGLISGILLLIAILIAAFILLRTKKTD